MDLKSKIILIYGPTASGKSRFAVILAKKVNGEIICQTANCSGDVKGKITVAELLTLHATASIKGDIITGKLAIEPGAAFTGNCSMGAVIKEMLHDKQDPKEKQGAQPCLSPFGSHFNILPFRPRRGPQLRAAQDRF